MRRLCMGRRSREKDKLINNNNYYFYYYYYYYEEVMYGKK
jgi:hypothetical protein